ncbi:hypothetical protein WR25_20042 [Diploscapter pachys]|uniref:Peptidase M3A/M3B catalytic domain-containing protein n=1 Tax=Diploscapter pachys TaxID=2018661 RepID=A0A2A2L4P0_9BILA|nr:hypothetical protein WR25_20042 [Diploscapter pachys]
MPIFVGRPMPIAKFFTRSLQCRYLSNHTNLKRVNASSLQVQQKRSILFRMGNERPKTVVGYYVIFPVIPDETVENNIFVRNIAKNEDWPRLASATPKEMYEGTVRMIMEYGATVMEHMEFLEKLPNEEKTFENVVEPLLTEEYEINYAFQTLMLKMLTDWPEGSRKLFDADLHHIKMTAARDYMEKLTHRVFQDSIKQLYETKEGLTDWQLRLIEWYLLEIKASGLDKTDKKSRQLIVSWNRWIDDYRSKYISNTIATNDQATFVLNERGALADAPPHVLQKLAIEPDKWETGPWRGILTPHSIFPFMQYCGNRHQRQVAWERWISKASFEHDFYNNSVNVEELRHNNEGLAKLLGYRSVSEHRLANKMAASPETVRSFLDALTRRMRPVVLDRKEAWTEFSHKKELSAGPLSPADLFYVCRKEAEEHYDVNPLELMNHFPFWPTFKNTCSIISHLFGLNFKDISENSGLERCHPEVRIFAVSDAASGEHLGRLYVDPYDRETKRGGWNTLLARTSSKDHGLDRLVYLIGSAIAPTGDSPSLLHYQQLQLLLFNLGRCVQLLLSKSPYRDITIPWTPYYASDWDAADMFPMFVQFFLYKPNLLQSLSSPHIKTGNILGEEAWNNVALSLQRATLWESYRTLFWSDFDLSLYEMEDRRQRFWQDLYNDMTKEYFPFKKMKSDYQPCSFMPIFAIQPNMSMYYRKLWTEMLALDIHETFDSENEEQKTGMRLRETILEKGAGDVAKELYRRFQGRDPSVGAICDFYDPPTYESIEEQQAKS